MARASAGVRVLGRLRRHGLLLLQDAELPSVVGAIVGGPVRGSWWAHPRGGEIFQAASFLADHRDVLSARLVAGKVTFVHRRRWPALAAVGRAREPWQLEGLSPAARRLLARLDKEGEVRTSGEPARELQRALLAVGRELHLESGAHALALSSWDELGRQRGLARRGRSAAQGRAELERAAAALAGRAAASPRLPWSGAAPLSRRPRRGR